MQERLSNASGFGCSDPGYRSFAGLIDFDEENAVGGVKSMWASVQGDPVFMRRVNGWLAIFWIIMIPISMMMGWLNSVVYVSALSLWALVSGHWSAWQAARVEVQQAEDAKAAERKDVPQEVVQKLVAETDIQASAGGLS